MIPEAEVQKLVDKLDSDRIIKFFRKNSANTVYFHCVGEADLNIQSMGDLDRSALQVPTLALEEDTYLVLHNHQTLSTKLAADDFQVATISVDLLVPLAESLAAVNGIAIQCSNCYFTVDLEELKTGLAAA